MTSTTNNAASDCGLVYIHGAGLDPWIWEELVQLLDTPHLIVSFPGRGERSVDRDDLLLQDYVDHVRWQIEEWPVEHVMIVAHSIGGVVGLGLVTELSDKVVGFVGICATIPKRGGSFLSCYPFHQRIVQQIFIRLLGTKPPDSAIRRSLCTGLSEEQTDRIIDQFTPESRSLYTDRCNAMIPNVPTLYVKTTDDDELGPSLQDTMIANLKANEVTTIDAGHMPMLSNPRKLAVLLDDFKEKTIDQLP